MNPALPLSTAPRRTRTIPASELTSADVAAWSVLQLADPVVASPFFRPEFTAAVAEVRSDARVAIVEDSEGAAGFFPFQVGRFARGHPIGGPLSDYQGAITRPGWEWDARELIWSCGVTAWYFDHLLAAQRSFEKFHHVPTESPIIDLSGGYARYAEEHVKTLSEPRKKRKLEREVGPVRFEVHCADSGMLETLMRWKASQYVDTGKFNIFTMPWVVAVVKRIHAEQGANFSGLLSVLYAGDTPVAAHMGMRSPTVWHYWFPAYDPDFAKYSPGMLLLLEMAAAAPSMGVKIIDMGKGKAVYKQRLQNGFVEIAEGSVPVAPVPSAYAEVRNGIEGLLRQSPLIGPARKLHVAFRDLENHLHFLSRLRSRIRFQ